MGHDISTLPGTELHLSDEITRRPERRSCQSEKKIGVITAHFSVTDFVTMSGTRYGVGYLIGEIGFAIGGSHHWALV